MKIASFGAEHFLGQLPRIREGWQFLGHECCDGKSDVIYSNDPSGYDRAIQTKEIYGGILILNVLDIHFHLSEMNKKLNELKPKLQKADIITSISKTTALALKRYLGLNSYIIYNPIKDITFLNLKKEHAFMSVGRLADPNKRFYLTSNSVNLFNQKINIFGSDTNNIQNNKINGHGIVSDETLENFYNTSKFYIATSYNEGLCLPMIEALVCGCIPIVCRDMTTAEEFIPEEFLCDPDHNKIAEKISLINQEYEAYLKIALSFGKKYAKIFNKNSIANNILNLL
jgi:glycosyltransferase involved in cell wall biosynthesis